LTGSSSAVALLHSVQTPPIMIVTSVEKAWLLLCHHG